MIKVILWDIDGTLLDFKAAEKAAIKTCFEIFDMGEISDEMIAEYSAINASYWERLERNEITKTQVLVGRFEEFFGKKGLDVSKASMFNDEYQLRLGDTYVYAPHAEETLRRLKEAGIVQCAVTNGTRIAQERKLKNSGMDKVFDEVFISDVVGIEKPNVGFFDHVLSVLQAYRKEEMIIVGDSLTSDIKGGNNACIRTCWFNPRHVANHKGVSVDHEIDDIGQVLSILEQLNQEVQE